MAMRKENSSKADDLYRRLKKRIVMSELQPGQQLVELELANALGCSQSTVREALLRLQEDGLIVRQGYRGTTVSPISPSESEIFLKIRMMLEAHAARLSIEHLQDDDVTELSSIVDDMEDAATNNDEYALFEKDLEFHMKLFQIANLPALTSVLTRCSVVNHRNKISQSDKRRALLDSAKRHRHIIAALQTGNADFVEEIISHHVSSIFDAIPSDRQTTRHPVNQMSDAMQTVFSKLTQEPSAFALDTLPLSEGRNIFERQNEYWNQFDARQFDIEYFEIPKNPFCRHPSAPIRAARIQQINKDPRGQLLYLHGGGWAFGSKDSFMAIMANLANNTGFSIYGIDYALAPEHPFPNGLNDCTWSWRWLRGQDTSGKPWFVAGDSTGANLALSMMLDLRSQDEHLPQGAALIYGMYCDKAETKSRQLFGQGEFGLNTKHIEWLLDNYRSTDTPEFARQRIFPAEADLNNLPPLFVIAAELDPLRDDSVELARKLAQSNTNFEFKQAAGVIHDFLLWHIELPEAAAVFGDIATFFQSHGKL